MRGSAGQGAIDAAYHWFNHVIYGAKHGFPVKAVMVFNDAPGMTVLVANRVKDQVRGVPDFKGRNIAEGAGYGTKASSPTTSPPRQGCRRTATRR